MPSNIELKSKMPMEFSVARKVAKQLTLGKEPEILNQVDTFFDSRVCRLKLREENGKSTLIAYERLDIEGPKRSDYVLSPVSDQTTMIEALSKSVGLLGQVKKRREASIVEWKGLSARIHLDQVENLGEFIEFEVIITDDSQVPLGEDMALYLSSTFGIKDDHLIKEAYFDLMNVN